MDGITIGELARRSGLSVSAIRFYQRRGLLPPRHSGTGWQRYDDSTVTQLAIIELAKRTGFSLDDIAVLLAAVDNPQSPAATWQAMFQAKIDQIDEQTRQLHTMRHLLSEALTCDCLTLDSADLIPEALGWASHTATTSRPDPNHRRDLPGRPADKAQGGPGD